jgi:hypothetical protein
MSEPLTADAVAAIRECLEIISLYGDENSRMKADVLNTPDDYYQDKNMIVAIHTTAYLAARNIEAAIRGRFELSPEGIQA